MPSPQYFPEPFTGARATPSLVGREEQIAQVVDYVRQVTQGSLIHIEGIGGIGKTRLLGRLLERLAEEKSLRAASELIDLYHAETNTVEGLASEICRVLQPSGDEFGNYLAARSELEAARLRGDESRQRLTERRDHMLRDFVADLQQLSGRRLIIALDTAEKLEFQRDAIAERLDLPRRESDTVSWLCQLISTIDNLTVLLAGRPGSGYLEKQLSELLQDRHYHVDLPGLDEQEALAYFDAIIERLEQSSETGDRRAVRLIKGLPEARRQAIFYSLSDPGPIPTVRPILLALAIDYMTLSDPNQIQEFSLAPEIARQLSPAGRLRIQEKLGEAVIETFSNRLAPADVVVRTLGWLRKGVTDSLLQRLSGLPTDEFTIAWAAVRALSFVKLRHRDQVLFLHDEMYAIVDKYALQRAPEAELERISKGLREYYESDIDTLSTAIDAQYRPLARTAQEVLSDINEINRLRRERRSQIVNHVYYRLRRHAGNGFQTYIRYANEAFAATDEELGELLRAEMRAFVEQSGLEQAKAGISGLKYPEVIADEAIRWLKWLHIAGQHDEGLKLARQLRNEQYATIIQPGGPLAEAELDSWAGLLETEVGNYVEAEGLLQQALKQLPTLPETSRRIAIQARAYNNLGYLYSNQGRYYDAVQVFERSLPLLRALGSKVDEARTLNNLAFALAEIGEFDDAHRIIREAIRLRERLGPQVPVAFSLNTLGEINIRDFASEIAVEQLQRALKLFSDFNHPRGRGLALRALAEATRRISVSPTNQQLGETLKWQEESEAYALEAVRIFRDDVDEPVRYVWALLELGCVYRDWLRWRRTLQPQLRSPKEDSGERPVFTVAALYDLSQDAYARADQTAQRIQAVNHRLDVLTNWAWLLYHYGFDFQHGAFAANVQPQLDQLTSELEALFRDRFGVRTEDFAKKLAGVPRDDYLMRLGDWETFLGEVALQHYRTASPRSSFAEAAEHFVLALACYQQYSTKLMRQSRRSYARIYDGLKTLSTDQLLEVYQSVRTAEAKYRLPNSVMMTFLTKQFGPEENLIVLQDEE